jgi:hypothetical protein
MMRRLVLALSTVLVLVLVAPRRAHAYLDPSTGSMLVSALISIAVTIGLALQTYGYRLLGRVRRLLGRDVRGEPDVREPVEPAP